MKKIVIFALLLSLIGIVSANAQFRLDVNVSVPVYYGFQTQVTGDFGAFAQFAFIIPELDVHYQFDLDIVKLGLGLRMFTLILETIALPDFFFELDIDPVVFRASICGGAALLFGLYNNVLTGALIVPDVSATVKLLKLFGVSSADGGDMLRLGAGCAFITDFNNLDNFMFIPYANVRLVFVIGGAKQESNEEDYGL